MYDVMAFTKLRIIAIATFTVTILLLPKNGLAISNRIFPAAQEETYNNNNEGVLGTVCLKHLSILSFGPNGIEKVVDPAIHRFQKSLLRFPDFKDDYQENPCNATLYGIDTLEIHVSSPNLDLFQGVDEGYSLLIKDYTSSAILRAKTVFGAVHGLETMGQLLNFGWMSNTGVPVFVIHGIPLYIKDEPSFEYRGLLIDTSRHYLPLNLILANLDAMSMNKMNVLHWHLTDSQSFPFKTNSIPEVADKGAFHPKMVYTTSDIENIVNEAYLRGIRVIPEIDMPGHTQAIAKSHPELMSHCPGPSEPLDPTKEEVYIFVDTIYKDLIEIFPDALVHVGGDEVNLDCWETSKSITKWMRQHNMSSSVELYEHFVTRLLRIVSGLGKKPIVWQEIFNFNLTITDETIVDVWKGFDTKTIEQATSSNFKVILSGCWYLDHLEKNWEDFYCCDPRNFTGNKHNMIGGHASMWGEHVDASNFMSRVWPRASSVAERLWTGDVVSAKKSIRERIHKFRCRLVLHGIDASPTGPGFCSHEVTFVAPVARCLFDQNTSLC